jgi:glycosyltransferase involved in cell wall biosynthesis
VKDVPQPSGQSVTLQASACGRPVVLTHTRGLWDTEGLRDGDNVLLVPPEDPDALVAAVERVLADPSAAAAMGRAARATVEASATVEGYAARLLQICESARAHP